MFTIVPRRGGRQSSLIFDRFTAFAQVERISGTMKGFEMKQRAKMAAVAAAAAVAFVLCAGVAPAQADVTIVGTFSGVARVNAFDQAAPSSTLWNADISSDGYGTRSHWNLQGITSGTLDNSGGAGSTVHKVFGSLPGITLAFDACIKSGSVTIACTSYHNDLLT